MLTDTNGILLVYIALHHVINVFVQSRVFHSHLSPPSAPPCSFLATINTTTSGQSLTYLAQNNTLFLAVADVTFTCTSSVATSTAGPSFWPQLRTSGNHAEVLCWLFQKSNDHKFNTLWMDNYVRVKYNRKTQPRKQVANEIIAQWAPNIHSHELSTIICHLTIRMRFV